MPSAVRSEMERSSATSRAARAESPRSSRSSVVRPWIAACIPWRSARVTAVAPGVGVRAFRFDLCCHDGFSQADFFEHNGVQPLVDAALAGALAFDDKAADLENGGLGSQDPSSFNLTLLGEIVPVGETPRSEEVATPTIEVPWHIALLCGPSKS